MKTLTMVALLLTGCTDAEILGAFSSHGACAAYEREYRDRRSTWDVYKGTAGESRFADETLAAALRWRACMDGAVSK